MKESVFKFDWFSKIISRSKQENIKKRSLKFNELIELIRINSMCVNHAKRYNIIENKLLEIEDISEDYADELLDPINHNKIKMDVCNAVKSYSLEIDTNKNDKFIDETLLLDIIRYDYVLKIINDLIKSPSPSSSQSKALRTLRNNIKTYLQTNFTKDEKDKLLTRLHNLCSIQIIDLLQKRRKSSVNPLKN